MDNNWETNQRY